MTGVLEGFVLPLCQQLGRQRESTWDAGEGLCVFFKTGEQLEEIVWSLFYFSWRKSAEYLLDGESQIEGVWDFGMYQKLSAVVAKNLPNL